MKTAVKEISSILILLILSGCTSTPKISTTEVPVSQQALDTVQDHKIPDMYLIKCKELEEYSSVDLIDIYEVTKSNNLKALDCYIRHNGLIEVLKNGN